MKNPIAVVLESAKLVVKSPAVALINLIFTALLTSLAVYWLQIGDAKVYQLVWAAVLAILIAIGWWWLDSGTAAFFYRSARGDDTVKGAYRQGFRRSLLFALVATVGIALWWLLDELHEPANQYANYLYSTLSAANRGRVGYEGIQRAFSWLLDLAQWFLLPVLILPWITMLCGASLTKESARHALGSYKRLGYWIGIVLSVLLAIWIPMKFIEWRFGTGLEGEMVSMIVRFALAYLFFIFGWLLALAVSAVSSLPERDVAPPGSATVSG